MSEDSRSDGADKAGGGPPALWAERISQHRAIETLDRLREHLTAQEYDADRPRLSAHRTLRVVDRALVAIRSGDPELTPLPVLHELATVADQCTAQLEAYDNNEQEQYLTTLDELTDAILVAIAPLSVPEPEAVRTEIGSMRQLAINESKVIRETFDERQKEGQAAQEAAAAKQSELETELASLKEQIAATSSELSTLVEGHRVEHGATLEAFQAQAAEQSDAAAARAQEVIADLERMQSEAKALVGVIGRTGMTGGYQQYETQERKDATNWRRYAIGFGIAAVAILLSGLAVALFGDQELESHENVSAAALTATLLGLATYAARQSARHRRNATSARTTSIAIASLGPYLESLTEKADRDEILSAFAFIFFAQSPASASKGDDGDDTIAPAQIQAMLSAWKARRSAPAV